MAKFFIDKYILDEIKHPLDDKIDQIFKREEPKNLEDRIFEKYLDVLKAMPKTYPIKAEIRKYQKEEKKFIESVKIPQDRMHIGFKDAEYTKPFAPRINPLVSKDGALTHNGMILIFCATRGAGKSILVSKVTHDGIQARYKVKVPMIILDTNPIPEWHTHSEPITRLPQLTKQKEKIRDHFMRWNGRKARGFTNIIYGFGFAKDDIVDRKFTLTLQDIFDGMSYDETLYISMFADLIGLDEGNIASRLELSRALKQGRKLKLENFTELKRSMRKKADEAQQQINKKLASDEESQAVKGRIVIPYIDNALDEAIVSDNKISSLNSLFDDIEDYDNVILRIKAQGGKSTIYQKRIGAYCIFFLDKIMQERNKGCSSEIKIRATSRLNTDKYPCGPILVLEEAKYIIPNTLGNYVGEYMEDQVNLGRKNGMVICVITQFADMINDKIMDSGDYTFVSKVNNEGTRKFLARKGIDNERIKFELETLKMKFKGYFGLELSEWKIININGEIKGPFVTDLPLSKFKIAGA